MQLFDAHCHLADRAFASDLEAVLTRAWEAGLVGVVCVGYDVGSSRAAIALAEREARVWAAVGVHPHNAGEADSAGVSLEALRAEIGSLARHPKVVAIGEAGLDYYRDLSPRPVQLAVFRLQAELALELGLPLLVHDRDAHAETLAVLQDCYGSGGARPCGADRPDDGGCSPGHPGGSLDGRAGVMHCFSGDQALAEACLALGFLLSFAGPLTYPKADRVRAVAAAVPAERILVETDSPYLAPQARRGRRNEPAFVAEVATGLALARGIAPERAASLTTGNARRLFALG